MATFAFSTFTDPNTAIAFDPAADVLNFDNSSVSAADVAVTSSLLGTTFTAGEQSVTLIGVTGAAISPGNVSFADGSQLLVGNQTAALTNENDGQLFTSGPGDDQMIGFAGIDTAAFSGTRADHTVTNNTDYWMVSSTADGTDVLRGIERFQFSDAKLAVDLAPTQHAGQAMGFIGAVAPQVLDDQSVRGTIISLLDQGNSLTQLSQLALDLNVVPHATNAELANAVYSNVSGGQTASPEMTTALVSYIDDNSQAEFLAAAAGLHLNVDLVGLQQTGVLYL